MPEHDPNKLVEQFTIFTYDIWHYNIQCLSSFSAWLLVPNSIVSVAHKDDHMFIEMNKDLSQFQWKSAHAPKKELPKDFL